MRKYGFDYHGVLDKYEVFREMCNDFVVNGHEVHIITGEEDTPKLRRELAELKIQYTTVFSITTYHKELGTEITLDENGSPWMDKGLWDRTKGDYCNLNSIDIHFDDTGQYKKYFKTPFCLVD